MKITIDSTRKDSAYATEVALAIKNATEKVELNFYKIRIVSPDFFNAIFSNVFTQDNFLADVEKIILICANKQITDIYVSSLKHFAFMFFESMEVSRLFKCAH